MKGRSYDNTVSKSTCKIMKIEFIKQRIFTTLLQSKLEFTCYVNWFNKHKIHSSLNYLISKEFERNIIKKVLTT